MNIVLAPKTIRGLDVHIMNILRFNMYLLYKKLRVLGLGVVLIEGAPTLMRVCDCIVMVVLPTTWFWFTIQFWYGIMLPIKRVGSELITIAPTVVLATRSSSHLCFLAWSLT